MLARMADDEEAIVEDMIARCMLCYTCDVVAELLSFGRRRRIRTSSFGTIRPVHPSSSRFALGRGCASD